MAFSFDVSRSSTAMDPRVLHAITFIKENLSCKLREQELAQQEGLTAQHFCVLFKAETGETPARYVHRSRMIRARELLEDDDHLRLSIKEIAVALDAAI